MSRSRRQSAFFGTLVACGAVVACWLGLASASRATIRSPESAGTRYYVALGDSLSTGAGATPGHGYVDDLFAVEQRSIPRLSLKNLGCGGDSTTRMIHGGLCHNYSTGDQLGDAKAFLRVHRGQVAFATIDVGGDDISGCFSGTSIDKPCFEAGLQRVKANLPRILAQLRSVGGAAPFVGLTYYDPYLAYWLRGGAAGPATAHQSLGLVKQFNRALRQIYHQYGLRIADGQAAFHSSDFSPDGSVGGHTLPSNVDLICQWTHMCSYGANIAEVLMHNGRHANDTGYSVLALAFEHVLAGLSPPNRHEPVSCTAPGAARDPKVADPRGPHGIFVLGSTLGANGSAIVQNLLHNPNVCGASLFVNWSQVDRGPGASPRYDWSRVKQQMAPWEAAGKTVNLIVWGASESSGVQLSTPRWVQSQVQMINCAGARTEPTPVFWQPGYMNNWQAFIKKSVAEFASDPHVGYLRFGLGTGGEGLVSPAIRQPACAAQWDAAGYQTAYPAYTREMITFEGSLHSPKQLDLGLNTFDGVPPPTTVGQDAAQAGIGIGMQGLQAKDVVDVQNRRPCVVNWCAAFEQEAGKIPLHLQPLNATQPAGGLIGPLPPLLQTGLALHAQIFELNPKDLLTAFDPQSPDYAQYHQEYAQAIEATTAVVGTASGSG